MPIGLVAYLCTALAVFALDFVWLSLTANHLYRAHLGAMMLPKLHLGIAAAFYIFYGFSLVVFAVMPALAQNDWTRALWGGALLGFTAYGAYDLTNQATLVGWSPVVTIADMLWGTVLSASGSVIGFFLTRMLKS